MLHFGYGSNLRAAFVRELLPGAKPVMKGYLPNYEVQWPAWSDTFRGGTSSIVENPGELVEGVLYDCPERELKELDYKPGLYVPAYKRETFTVLGEDGQWHRAELYRLRALSGPFPPSRSYVEGMLSGAREVGLSPAYIDKIEGWLRQSIAAGL
jgi:hypothetical protein